MRLPFPAVLDSTMLNTFRDCPQQFYLSYVRRLSPAGRNPHFNAGGAFAKGLETARRHFWKLRTDWEACQNPFFLTQIQNEAIAVGLTALTKAYGDYEPPDKNRHKSWERVAIAYLSYFERYPLLTDHLQVAEIGGQRMVEFSFAIPLPINHPESGDPLIYGGRLDWIARYKDQSNALFAVDEKTTKYFTETWASHWSLRAQLTGYAYACRHFGIPVAGSIVRGTALKLTEIDHAEAILALPQWRLDRWYDQTLRDIQRMIQCWESGYWDWNLGNACTSYSGCSFQELCKVQNYEPWITEEAGMFVPNTWNPLAKEDES